MTDRERLIELIRKAKKNTKGANCDLEREMLFADYLLENGVIVPPCKVGDTVYFIIDDAISGEAFLDSQQINDVSTRGIFVSSDTLVENCDTFEPYSNFGETSFLTREEAEKALAERSVNNAT